MVCYFQNKNIANFTILLPVAFRIRFTHLFFFAFLSYNRGVSYKKKTVLYYFFSRRTYVYITRGLNHFILYLGVFEVNPYAWHGKNEPPILADGGPRHGSVEFGAILEPLEGVQIGPISQLEQAIEVNRLAHYHIRWNLDFADDDSRTITTVAVAAAAAGTTASATAKTALH